MHWSFAPVGLQVTGRMSMTKLQKIAFNVLVLATALTPVSAQEPRERTIDQYQCRDIMRDSGANRDVAVAFLHGFILGKSGRVVFNLDDLHNQTDAFIERCLSNPNEKAVEAMIAVKQ
jgi:hypothetical protein